MWIILAKRYQKEQKKQRAKARRKQRQRWELEYAYECAVDRPWDDEDFEVIQRRLWFAAKDKLAVSLDRVQGNPGDGDGHRRVQALQSIIGDVEFHCPDLRPN